MKIISSTVSVSFRTGLINPMNIIKRVDKSVPYKRSVTLTRHSDVLPTEDAFDNTMMTVKTRSKKYTQGLIDAIMPIISDGTKVFVNTVLR